MCTISFQKKLEPSTFPNLFAIESFLYSKTLQTQYSQGYAQLSVHTKMIKMNELEAPPGHQQEPQLQVNIPLSPAGSAGPSLPASPVLLGPTCPPATATSLAAPRAAGHIATSGSISKFCKKASCRGCPLMTIQLTYDPRSIIILISTLSHNKYAEIF